MKLIKNTKTLICFGDSITANEYFEDGTPRLTPLLQNKFPTWNIINAGVSGDNSFDLLNRLKKDVLDKNPDLVMILIGANDAASHKMIDVNQYKQNLLTMVNTIGSVKTILLSVSPVDENRPRNRTNQILKTYANATKEVSLETGCLFIDVFNEMLQINDYTAMLSDGLHLNKYGYHFLSQFIINELTNKNIVSSTSNIVELSHHFIKEENNKNIAIDATCGNGHDTVFLSKYFKQVYSFDIQPLAIKRTKEKIKDIKNIQLFQDDFNHLHQYIGDANVILFNLGFLPGSNKKINTKDYSSHKAIIRAYQLITHGRLIVCCYTKHEGGLDEYHRIIDALDENDIQYRLYDQFDNEEKLLLMVK